MLPLWPQPIQNLPAQQKQGVSDPLQTAIHPGAARLQSHAEGPFWPVGRVMLSRSTRMYQDASFQSPAYSPGTGAGRRKISRNMPGVRADSGFTLTFGWRAGPVRLKLNPISPSPLRVKMLPMPFRK